MAFRNVRPSSWWFCSVWMTYGNGKQEHNIKHPPTAMVLKLKEYWTKLHQYNYAFQHIKKNDWTHSKPMKPKCLLPGFPMLHTETPVTLLSDVRWAYIQAPYLQILLCSYGHMSRSVFTWGDCYRCITCVLLCPLDLPPPSTRWLSIFSFTHTGATWGIGPTPTNTVYNLALCWLQHPHSLLSFSSCDPEKEEWWTFTLHQHLLQMGCSQESSANLAIMRTPINTSCHLSLKKTSVNEQH